MEVWHFLHAAEEVVRAGVFHSFLHQVVRVEPVSLRKFGYSEHCVYTGAMLSFICILLWFLEIQFWERKFLVLISGDSFWERRFLF